MRFAANSPDGSQLLLPCKRGKDAAEGVPGPGGLAGRPPGQGLGAGEAPVCEPDVTKERKKVT